ncbi:exosortase [Kordiimonas sediminis]|uniref:exosortase n=1 Tax=Kordiimonas sediminis TaxID=1735581 RepID=UPI00174A2132|nr:exosortase [Kordiimonas sediminis]
MNKTEAISDQSINLRAFVQKYHYAILLFLAYCFMYFETYQELFEGPWSTDQDGHGPFIVMLAIAVGYYKWTDVLASNLSTSNSSNYLGGLFLLVGLLFFTVGHSQELILFDAGSQIPVLIGLTLILGGYKAVLIFSFPILFLLFSVPLPGWVLDGFTQPMKLFLSETVTNLLYSYGYPIAQNGVTLYIDQYQLLVKDACVGLNSLFSLSAVGVFYIYLVKPERLIHTLLLVSLIIPAAIAANFLRVLFLVLITYYFGDEAGQGFLHDFSGLVMFLSALMVFLMIDQILVRGGVWLKKKKSHEK